MVIKISLFLVVAGFFSSCSQTCDSLYERGTPNYQGCLKTSYRSENCDKRLRQRRYNFQDSQFISQSASTCE